MLAFDLAWSDMILYYLIDRQLAEEAHLVGKTTSYIEERQKMLLRSRDIYKASNKGKRSQEDQNTKPKRRTPGSKSKTTQEPGQKMKN